MDENENRISGEELTEFSLEDIMREFGADSDAEIVHDEVTPELLADFPQLEYLTDTPMAAESDVQVWTPGAKEEPVRNFGDTQAFTPLGSGITGSAGDTVRIDTAEVRAKTGKPMTGDTIQFTPLGENASASAPEPFSEGWEPEYDEPIGEYVPPEPIIFRPRSRLGELKRKLMEGPEKRYYALSEQGVGKLQIALFVSMLIVVLAVASIVLHRLDMVRENRMRLLVFGELFAMMLSTLLCWERLADGVVGLFKGRFNTDTLLLFSFAACVADGVFCLQQVKVPFCAAFCLQCLMCLWSEYQKRSTELCQMDTLRKATRLNRIAKAPDCHDGRPGFFVSEGQPEDFMDTYNVPAAPEKALNRFALIALLLSVVVAVVAGIRGGAQAGIRTWSAAILAACPATMLICQSRPAWTLQRRLHRFGSVICGWQGIRAAAGKAAVPLKDEDLLPVGSVKINGVKFYSGRNPDIILAYASAVISESGSCLAPLFEHMVTSRRAQTYELEEFKAYGSEGCGGMICGESVLVGTQEFLKKMGVEPHPGTRVNQAVYVSIDGEFSCVIALAFGKLKGVSAGLASLCGQRRLAPVLASNNFVLDEAFIRSKYHVDTRRIAFPQSEERDRLAAWQPEAEQCTTCALTTQDGLAGAAFAVTGARTLRIAAVAGAVVHILGGVVGMAAVLVLTLSGRVDLLTPANLLLLELCWAVPGLMISEWTRNI